MDRLANLVTRRLRDAGVRDRLALVSPNCLQYPVLIAAALRLGVVLCVVSPRFPGETIRTMLDQVNCHHLIDLTGRTTSGEIPDVRRIDLPHRFGEVGAGWRRSDEDARVLNPDQGATIVFTSGSSGIPRPVLHTLSNHYYSALGANRNIPVGPGDRWLLSLPLYHVGGLGIVFRTILGGAAMVIPTPGQSLRDVLKVHGVTHLSLVATQLRRLLKDPPSEAIRRRLSAVLVGGGPAEVALMTQAYDAGFPVHTTYGLTEMASQVTTTGPGDGRSRLATSGKVLHYRQVRIDEGEILVKGETLFTGYVDRGRTDPSRDDEGWFRSGDLGSMGEDGYLTLTGRKDNMFISGGENIHPEEIEARLLALPDVFQAVVVPVKDHEFGFRPAAFVQFHGNKGFTEEKMIARLEKDLPRFKIPVAFFEWPERTGQAGFKPSRPYLIEVARSRWEKERDA